MRFGPGLLPTLLKQSQFSYESGLLGLVLSQPRSGGLRARPFRQVQQALDAFLQGRQLTFLPPYLAVYPLLRLAHLRSQPLLERALLTMFPPIKPRHQRAVVKMLLERQCTVGEAVAECLKKGKWSDGAVEARANYQRLMASLTSGDPDRICGCLTRIPGGPAECSPVRIERFLQEAKTNFEDAVDSLLEQLFASDAGAEKPSVSKAVELYTMQGAKGLTRRYIILPGCEKLWLSRRAKGIDPEEEKRLFYVAITRAKDRVLITHPWSRVGKGENIDPLCRGKPFGREISPFVEKLGAPMPTMWIN